MNSDLNDIRYLYMYGEHIGANEIGMAQYLNSLSQSEIDSLAHVYTEGYRKGFVIAGKDLSIKDTVDIRYNIGFERIIKSAILDFEKMGLKPIIYPLGYGSTMCNKQYWFDHKFDEALYLDKAFVKRKLEVAKQAFENRKDLALKMAGPAVIEIFGENPFEPESKKEAYKLTKEQQKLSAGYINEYQRIVQEHIPGDQRSFTIIAFPIPEFGHNFKEMFDATVKINTLDSEKYEIIQNKIIDELDKADYVRVVGKGDNRTYINVKLHELNNPEKETNFENCLADVNIPLGEVFTSPVLKGTNGILHVSEVYLGELKYKDLEIKANIGNVPDEHHRSTDLSSYSGSTSVYDNKFVFVMASLGYIACYEKLVDGAIQLLWDFYLEEPKYVKKQLDRKNLKLGFSDVKMTKNYIFCSYFGQKYVRENRRNIKVHNILVFDHNGHFLANLHTDRSASRLSVSDDEKTIYAVTEEPEIAIVRFDISNILK